MAAAEHEEFAPGSGRIRHECTVHATTVVPHYRYNANKVPFPVRGFQLSCAATNCHRRQQKAVVVPAAVA
ncbi:unnamed protein product [Ceratitis capitata]|uniref:(Mediterranean fruit fly) hypothetical protein n=1 Tax=Ceratitis capitata TaxID=7213 RepID=A0A811VHR4_CERCA|nr:unnamed protein product [Ceratitis capitata]